MVNVRVSLKKNESNRRHWASGMGHGKPGGFFGIKAHCLRFKTLRTVSRSHGLTVLRLKNVFMILLTAPLCVQAVAADQKAQKIYRDNCVACHRKLPVSLESFFFNYLLKYSSERRVKKALRDFITHPTAKKALASEEVIKRYGLMPPTTLNDTDLRRAIDVYWDTYKVFGKIK